MEPLLYEPALGPMFKEGICAGVCAVPSVPPAPVLLVNSVNSVLSQYAPLYVVAITAAACALLFLVFPRLIYALANISLYLILMDVFHQYQRHVAAGYQEGQIITLGFLGVGFVFYLLSLFKVFL